MRITVTNIFNQCAVVNPNTDITTRRTGGAASNLAAVLGPPGGAGVCSTVKPD